MNRPIILFATALLAGIPYLNAADSQKGAASMSFADDALSKDVLRSLKQIENGLRLTGEVGISPFGSTKVLQKEIVRPPSESGVWIEEWQIQRVGYAIAYAIKFMPSTRGGTDVSILQPAWRMVASLNFADSLSKVVASEVKWIEGVVSRTPGMKGKYRIEANNDQVKVNFDAAVDEAQSAAAIQNLRKMRADLVAFYGSAPTLTFKFRNAEFNQ